uniref:A-kinase anchoring protein 14 n=1 Tax=Dromaius novaehollandiae TaxID=8790 RepID=A0A8C4JVK1_DRONO
MEEKARSVIANVISSAKQHLLDLQKKGKGSELALFAVSWHLSEPSQKAFSAFYLFSETEYVIKNIQWTTCKNFTVERGKQQIEEYISVSDGSIHSFHCKELKYSKRYHYRVCWSVPTRRKPIPRATASVYFIIEISKIKPALAKLEFNIVLAIYPIITPSSRPGQCRFREKWLKDIIENKITLMESLTS